MWAMIVWVWVPVRGSICLFWREIPTKGFPARFLTRPEEDGGRKVSELKRRSQSREVEKTDQSTDENRVVSRREQELGLWTQGRFGQRRRWVSIPWWLCGNFARVHVRFSSQKHRLLGKFTDSSLLTLGANSSPWLFVLLFFHSLGCVCNVLYVRKKCRIHLVGKTTRRSNGYE